MANRAMGPPGGSTVGSERGEDNGGQECKLLPGFKPEQESM